MPQKTARSKHEALHRLICQIHEQRLCVHYRILSIHDQEFNYTFIEELLQLFTSYAHFAGMEITLFTRALNLTAQPAARLTAVCRTFATG